MKKIKSSSLSVFSIKIYTSLLLLIAGSATASAQSIARVVNKHTTNDHWRTEKIEKNLKNSFPNAEKLVWSEKDNGYTSYVNDKVKFKIWYNNAGEVIKTLRSYSEDELSPFLLAKIKHSYAGKTIFLVTEVINVEGIYYYIILEDDKKWYRIKADGSNKLSIVMEYDKI